MQKRKPIFEDKFDRKARAHSRNEFHQKREKLSYKYIVGIDNDEDENSNTGVMPSKQHKGK